MFLEALTPEEACAFLDLAWIAAETDGEVAEEERSVLNAFLFETRLLAYERSSRTESEITDMLAKAPRAHRHIVMIELCGLWAADRTWADKEIEMLERIAAAIKIPLDVAHRMKRWANEFCDVVADGLGIIYGGRE